MKLETKISIGSTCCIFRCVQSMLSKVLSHSNRWSDILMELGSGILSVKRINRVQKFSMKTSCAGIKDNVPKSQTQFYCESL